MPNGDGLDHGTTGGWADAVIVDVPAVAETPIAPGTRGSFADATAEVGAGSPHITRGTEIYYNGVEIINATTLEWNEEVAYDGSGTDAIGTKYKCRFRGYIHVQGVGSFFPGGATAPTYINTTGGNHGSATDAYIDIHKRLWEPRKTLRVKVSSSDVVIECHPPGTVNNIDRDVDNGPKPRGLSIAQIVNNQVFKVEWSVEFMKVDCRELGAPPEILNNRWSVSEEMDGDFYTTRTIRGHLRLSASHLVNPHNWRHVVVPGLEETFKRERIEYAVSENGLECEYQVTDKQVYNAAPWPATDISGSYTTSTNDGISFVSACNVRLVGAPNSPRLALIARAMQIVDSRLNYSVKRNLKQCFPESCSITESIGPVNTVEINMSIREHPSTPENFLAHLSTSTLGQPLTCPTLFGQTEPYKVSISPSPSLYGYNLGGQRSTFHLFLMACFLQSPCDNEHDIYNTEQSGNPGREPASPNDTQVTQVAPGVLTPLAAGGDSSSVWNPGQLAGNIYTFSRAESKYLLKPCRAQLPFARKVEYQGQSTADTCVFIDLAPGIATREMTVDCERIGLPPQVPEPQDQYTDGSLKGRLLEHFIVGLPSTLSADGQTRIFRVRAFYRWGMNRMPTAYDSLKLGALPFTSQNANTDNRFSGAAQYNATLGP